MTEVRLEWENWQNNWSIFIPYEINHNFFMEIQIKIKKWDINMKYISIAWVDRGKWFSLGVNETKQYIADCKYLKENLDEIIKKVPLPNNMWNEDWRYEEWFIRSKKIINTIFDEQKKVSKEDIILLLDLMLKKANEAIAKWVWLQFVWD